MNHLFHPHTYPPTTSHHFRILLVLPPSSEQRSLSRTKQNVGDLFHTPSLDHNARVRPRPYQQNVLKFITTTYIPPPVHIADGNDHISSLSHLARSSPVLGTTIPVPHETEAMLPTEGRRKTFRYNNHQHTSTRTHHQRYGPSLITFTSCSLFPCPRQYGSSPTRNRGDATDYRRNA